MAVIGTNRRSTGVGVRPREQRIEVTADFTPDPGLMMANAALIVGVVRDVMAWPSYELEELDLRPIPVVAGVVPGKHTTRKGWLTKDFQYPQSPYTCDIDARIWDARDGSRLTLRDMAGRSPGIPARIRRRPDPFTVRHLLAIPGGRAPSMLELPRSARRLRRRGRLCAGARFSWPRGAARGAPLAVGIAHDGVRHLRRLTERDRASYLAGDVPAPLAIPKAEISADDPVVTVAAPKRPGNGRAHAPAAPSVRKAAAAPGNGGAPKTPRPRRRSDNPLPAPPVALR